MQERVDNWIGGLDVKYFQPLEILAAMTEELGEIAKELGVPTLWLEREYTSGAALGQFKTRVEAFMEQLLDI